MLFLLQICIRYTSVFMQVTESDNIRRELDNQDTTVHTSEFQPCRLQLRKPTELKSLMICGWLVTLLNVKFGSI